MILPKYLFDILLQKNFNKEFLYEFFHLHHFTKIFICMFFYRKDFNKEVLYEFCQLHDFTKYSFIYLNRKDFNKEVLYEFCQLHDFTGQNLDVALR